MPIIVDQFFWDTVQIGHGNWQVTFNFGKPPITYYCFGKDIGKNYIAMVTIWNYLSTVKFLYQN